MSKDNVETLVSENLKVRVVLKDPMPEDAPDHSEEGAMNNKPTPVKSSPTALSPSSAADRRLARAKLPTITPEEYTYHYGRIMIAVGLVLVLLLWLGYVVYDVSQNSVETNTISEPLEEVSLVAANGAGNTGNKGAAESNEQPESVAATSRLNQATGNRLEAGAAPTLSEIESTTSAQAVSSPVDLSQRTGTQLPVQADTSLNNTSQSKAVLSQETDAALSSAEPLIQGQDAEVGVGSLSKNATAADIGTEPTAVVPRPNSAIATDASSGVTAEIFSDDVVEARMSAHISDTLQPLGYLSQEIGLGEPAFQTVYVFTSLSQREDDKLVYRWYLNDQLQAEVPVLVRGNVDWQSYSSKNINGQMLGPWKIELQTLEGEVLMQAKFNVSLL